MDLPLLKIDNCFVYKIPATQSVTAGYRCSDWSLESFLWNGSLQIVSVGEKCFVRMIDSKTGKLFAECRVSVDEGGPNSIEPVIDSSRYFVLRIENGKKHAFIGMGFTERAEAFEFNATIADFRHKVKRELEFQQSMATPAKDLSLKEGETIKINVKTKSSTKPKTPKTSSNIGFNSDFTLAPPPSGVNTTTSTSSKIDLSKTESFDDNFGDFESSNNDGNWVAF